MFLSYYSSKIVNLVTNCFGAHECEGEKDVPEAVVYYRKVMNAIDLIDQFLNPYFYPHRNKGKCETLTWFCQKLSLPFRLAEEFVSLVHGNGNPQL